MSREVLEALIRQVIQHTTGPVSLAWQGGEPTLAGLDFFMQVVELEMQYARPGQIVGNALQTNGILLNGAWAEFLRQYKFLVGLSLDGPAEKYGDFLCTMFDLWYNGGNPSFSERMFEAFLSQLLAHESDLCLFRKSCDSYLVVEANGDV